MTADNQLVPAAQYVRMSTEHQQYSIDNQSAAIQRYGESHGFAVVRTYSDPAKSGLSLRNRRGLRDLLQDVAGGKTAYKAILVYDVSRWGRFQDTDEAAHYEFLCKSAGVPIHYCAETFVNDGSLPSSIMKVLKRAMAGEYSRELSVKVRAGLFRLASLGYKTGGSPVYGLRRQLLDTEGRPKQRLEYGQRKSLVTERVVLEPGPVEEIAIVQQIFRDFADEHRSPRWIAARLNRDGVPYLRGAEWKAGTIRNILQDVHYVGIQVWGRTTALLSQPVKRLPLSQWAVSQKAFAPIVSEELFVRAQCESANFTCRLTDEQLLERLRKILQANGKLSGKIIDKSRLCPGLTTYHTRFGGLTSVYMRLGYDKPEMRSQVLLRQRTMLLRDSLINSILDAFPGMIIEVRRSKRFRPLLRYRKTGLIISVFLARCCSSKAGLSWMIEVPRPLRKRTTVLAFLDEDNTCVKSLTVVAGLPLKDRHLRVRQNDEWLRVGEPLEKVSDFLTILDRVRNNAALRKAAPSA